MYQIRTNLIVNFFYHCIHHFVQIFLVLLNIHKFPELLLYAYRFNIIHLLFSDCFLFVLYFFKNICG